MLNNVIDRSVDAGVREIEKASEKARTRFFNVTSQLLQRSSDATTFLLRVVTSTLSITTAVAAGFLTGIGLDIIAVVDKISILSSLFFYSTIFIALLSPVLALPRIIHHNRSQQKQNDNRIAYANKRLADLINLKPKPEPGEEINRAVPTTQKPTLLGRIRRLLNHSKKPEQINIKTGQSIASSETLKLDRDIEIIKNEIAALHKKNKQGKSTQRLMQLLEWIGIIVLAILVISTLLFVLSAVWAWILIAAIAVTSIIGLRFGPQTAMPLLSVCALASGLAFGNAALSLEPNSEIQTENSTIKAAIIFSTNEGFAVVEKSDIGNRIGFIGRTHVKRIRVTHPWICRTGLSEKTWYARTFGCTA